MFPKIFSCKLLLKTNVFQKYQRTRDFHKSYKKIADLQLYTSFTVYKLIQVDSLGVWCLSDYDMLPIL